MSKPRVKKLLTTCLDALSLTNNFKRKLLKNKEKVDDYNKRLLQWQQDGHSKKPTRPSLLGFGELKEKADYDKIQAFLLKQVESLGPGFLRIYFDLLWGEDKETGKLPRYNSWGDNLFETNFGEPP